MMGLILFAALKTKLNQFTDVTSNGKKDPVLFNRNERPMDLQIAGVIKSALRFLDPLYL